MSLPFNDKKNYAIIWTPVDSPVTSMSQPYLQYRIFIKLISLASAMLDYLKYGPLLGDLKCSVIHKHSLFKFPTFPKHASTLKCPSPFLVVSVAYLTCMFT